MLNKVQRYDQPLAADFPISTLPLTSEEAPAIDGSKVVWYDDRTQGPTDVWGFDFATNQAFQVTSHPVAQFISDVGGDIVAYEDNRNGTWDIYATRLSTGVEFVVATGPNHQRYPRVWGDYIVYQDETSDYFQSDVYLYQISSAVTTALAVAPSYQGRPDIDDGRIVWTDWRTGKWQLAVHEIASGATTFRSIDCDDACRPRIDGHEVVWNGWRSGNYDIYLLDILTGDERVVYAAPGDQRFPAISESLIVWQDEATYGNWNVFVYVRANGTLFPASIEPSLQQYPAVSGNIVVWQDNRGHTWDIYGLVWDGAVPPIQGTLLRNPSELHVGAYPGGEIRLGWTDTVTNELGFVVQRASGIFGTDWSDYATLPAGATSYVDTATELGESYWYRVRAYNPAGNSSYSNESYSTAFDSVPSLDERYGHLLINDARMDPGAWGYPALTPVDPLGWDANLAYSAHAHALGMNNSNCCQGHVDLAARGPTDRALDSGYPYGVGENLFVARSGRAGMEAGHQGFMDSEGHRNNIMAPDLKQTAVGFAPGGRGTLVQVFSGGPMTTVVPALPSGIAVPYAGPVETEFDFLVSFWNPGLTAPTKADVVIDGVRHRMMLRNGQPGRGTYRFTTQLPLGNHAFHFEFAWGAPVQTARLPVSGEYSGPFVREHMPDLAASGISTDKFAVGQEGGVLVWVLNAGEVAAQNVAVRFYLGDPARGGTQIGATATIAEVLPQQMATANILWTPPTAGAYSIYAVVDPDNLITESSEENNRIFTSVLVREAGVTWYVDARVGTSGDGHSPATAFRTIQEAWPSTFPGDTVQAAPGIYQGQVTVPAGVTLRGASFSSTVLDARGLHGPVVRLSPGAVVENFTITGSGSDYFDCGVWLDEGTAAVRHNRITGNAAGIWAWCFDAATCDMELMVEHNIIDGNTSNGINSNNSPILRVTHNTIVDNEGSGIILNNAQSVAVDNLVIGNADVGIDNRAGAEMHHNDVWDNGRDYNGGNAGEGSLSADPMFRDRSGADYRLHAGSPAVGRGSTAKSDMGALPFVPAGVAPANVRVAQTGTAEWTVSWTKGTALGYFLYAGTAAPGLYASRVDVGGATSHVLRNLPAAATHYVAVSAYNGDGDESLPSDPLSLQGAFVETYKAFLSLITR